MSKSCSDAGEIARKHIDFLYEQDQEKEQTFNENFGSFETAPANSPKAKFWRAINQVVSSSADKYKEVTNWEYNGALRQEKVDKLLLRYFKNNNEQRNQIRLSLQLTSLAASDPAIKELIYDKHRSLAHYLEPAQLSRIGQPIEFKDKSDLPELHTLPLPHLRIILHTVSSAMHFQEKRKVMTPWRMNWFFEWTLPKNVGEKMLSQPLNRLLKKMENFKNEETALGNNFMKPKPYENRDENIPLDPYTNKPIREFPQTLRHNAGITQLLGSVRTWARTANHMGKNQFRSETDVFEFFSDYRNGKAFFTKEGVGTGKFGVYMFGIDRKVPTGGTYADGGLKYKWSGKDYTKEQKQKIIDEGKDVKMGNYVEPWVASSKRGNKNPLIFDEQEARFFEMVNRSFDRIMDEVYDTVIERTEKLENSYKKLVKELDPEILATAPEMALDTLKRITKLYSAVGGDRFDQIRLTQEKRKKLVIGTQSGTETYYDVNGDKVIGFPVDRYYPDRYHIADIPEIFRETMERLEEEIDILKPAASFNRYRDVKSEDDASSAKMRRDATKQIKRAYANLGSMKDSMSRYLFSDEIQGGEDRYDNFTLPFIKEFKSVKQFIPARYKRKDADVFPNYIKSLTAALSEGELAYEAVRAIVTEKDPVLQKYMLNHYLKYMRSPDAKGILFGLEFSDRDLANRLGVDLKKMVAFYQSTKRYLIGANLSSAAQGVAQLPSMAIKVAEMGLTKTTYAIAKAESTEGLAHLYQVGVLNFEEMIDEAMENVLAGNVSELDARKYRQAKKRAEENIKKLRKSQDTLSNREKLHSYETELKKLKIRNPILGGLFKKLSDYAVQGAGKPPGEDASPVKWVGWTVKRIANLFPMTRTERVLRGTSFFLGHTNYMELHPDSDPFDPAATDAGMRLMQQTDMFLGMEGVGANFGTEFQRLYNSVTVWNKQMFGRSYRNTTIETYVSVLPRPEEAGGENRVKAHGKAMLELTKYLMAVHTAPASIVGGAATGAVALAAVGSGWVAPPNWAFVGAILAGGVSGYTLQDSLGATEQKTKLRMRNRKAFAGVAEWSMQAGVALATNLVMFNSNPSAILGGGTAALIARYAKRKTYGNAGKLIGGLNSPLHNLVVGAIYMLYKLRNEDEDDVDTKDLIRMIGLLGGLGLAATVNLLFAGTEAGREGLINIMKIEAIDEIAEKINKKFTAKEIIKDLPKSLLGEPKRIKTVPLQKF